jgi:hypothetical protein
MKIYGESDYLVDIEEDCYGNRRKEIISHQTDSFHDFAVFLRSRACRWDDDDFVSHAFIPRDNRR